MSANDRQVAGSHYKQEGKPQHWDLVVMYEWDYFQGQITKYLMRWRSKNGLQDLEKAAHFLEKYIEEVKAGRIDNPKEAMAVSAGAIAARVMADNAILRGEGTTTPEKFEELMRGAAQNAAFQQQRVAADPHMAMLAEARANGLQWEGVYGSGENVFKHLATGRLVTAKSVQDALAQVAATLPAPPA